MLPYWLQLAHLMNLRAITVDRIDRVAKYSGYCDLINIVHLWAVASMN